MFGAQKIMIEIHIPKKKVKLGAKGVNKALQLESTRLWLLFYPSYEYVSR